MADIPAPSSQRTPPTLDWRPADSTCLDIIRGVEGASFPNVVLMGWALRDRYLGTPVNDYDLWANTNAFKLHPGDPDGIKRAVYEQVASIPGTTDIQEVTKGAGAGPDLSHVTMGFMLNGKPVELTVGDQAPNTSLVMRDNATPICAIAMDSSGIVVAHPEFQNHANRKIFAPNNDTPENREYFERLSRKIPDLQYQGSPPIQAQQYSKDNTTDRADALSTATQPLSDKNWQEKVKEEKSSGKRNVLTFAAKSVMSTLEVVATGFSGGCTLKYDRR